MAAEKPELSRGEMLKKLRAEHAETVERTQELLKKQKKRSAGNLQIHPGNPQELFLKWPKRLGCPPVKSSGIWQLSRSTG